MSVISFFLCLYEKIKTTYKTKETSVIEYITKQFSKYYWVLDKKFDGGCSSKRPDMFLEVCSHN